VDAKGVVDAADVILVYFSAHWCPPCKGFTPVLKEFYEAMKDHGVCIIFVSSDSSKEEMDSYFQKDHADYYVAEHEGEMGRALESNCGVSGIPSLCVVDKNGGMLSKEGRGKVQSSKDDSAKQLQAVADWKALYSK